MSNEPPVAVAATNALPLRIETKCQPITFEAAREATELWRSVGLKGRWGIDGQWHWG